MLHLLYLFVNICAIRTVFGQLSGCPLYGCTPSGSFSLDKVLTSQDIRVAWTAQIDNSSRTSNIDYGCVSNGNNLVCPTSNGYVSLDPKTGKELWRTKNLLRPTLPLIDIYGDVIGCDGPVLVKIDSDGSLEPIIHLDLPLDSIYSLNLMTESNALVIVSRSGMVVAYLTNGVPLASLQLNGTSDGQKGTFHPIAPPVVSGQRVYVLTEFSPASTNGQKKFSGSNKLRMYAVDVVRRMVKIISVAWRIDFNHVPTMEIGSRQASLLVTGDKILTSLSSSNSSHLNNGTTGMLWSIKDNGMSAEFVYGMNSNISKIALYTQNSVQPISSLSESLLIKQLRSMGDMLWGSSVTGKHIIGVTWKNGNTFVNIPLRNLFGTNVSISSNVMVGEYNNNAVLVFGLRNSSELSPLVVGIEIEQSSFKPTILWKLNISGQIINAILSGQIITFQPTNSNSTNFAAVIRTGSKTALISAGSIQ